MSSMVPSAAAQHPSTQGRARARAGSSYFTEIKKGEVNELRTILRNITVERDQGRRREVIKKVIAYMTMGIDVSRLFPEMMLASQSSDIVIKKMVYLYLIANVQANEELAVLVINTFDKDCKSEDPTIRGLALRALLSLNLGSILEYIVPPLMRSLNDKSAYVRKTGVLGVLKLHRLNAASVTDNNLIATVEKMLYDKDPQVVVNSLLAVNELTKDRSFVNRKLILYLLTRIKSFNEWGQCIVLQQVALYKPVDDDEMFTIMNLLDSSLRVNNSAVVLACSKCFLRLTDHLPDIHKQVFLRLKTPFLTLICKEFSVAHCVLSHILVFLPKATGVFDDEYKQFYCRYNEPSNVQMLKIEILSQIANSSNYMDISNELGEYTTSTNEALSRLAASSLGSLALRVEESTGHIVRLFIHYVNNNVECVNEVASSLKDVLRRFSHLASITVNAFLKLSKSNLNDDGLEAFLWMLGHFGEMYHPAPYIIEKYIQKKYDTLSNKTKLQLLSAAMVLFFKRPGEMQGILGGLLKIMMTETLSQDLHDRALLYYRLLKTDIVNCKRIIVGGEKCSTYNFIEDKVGVMNRVYKDLDTLSVIYRLEPEMFLSEENYVEEKMYQGVGNNTVKATDIRRTTVSDDFESFLSRNGTPTGSDTRLIDFDSLGPGSPSAPQVSQLQLKANASLTPPEFQKLWGTYPIANRMNNVKLRSIVSTVDWVTKVLAEQCIYVLASGDSKEKMKFFIYGVVESNGKIILGEIVIDRMSQSLSGDIRTSDGDLESATGFTDIIETLLVNTIDLEGIFNGVMF